MDEDAKEAPPPLDADAVAAELLPLFEAAKGLSLSVLMASRRQERIGMAMQAMGDNGDGDSDGY